MLSSVLASTIHIQISGLVLAPIQKFRASARIPASCWKRFSSPKKP